jgi:hypothetical protein
VLKEDDIDLSLLELTLLLQKSRESPHRGVSLGNGLVGE